LVVKDGGKITVGDKCCAPDLKELVNDLLGEMGPEV
jgi:hypothetical protein